MFVLPGDTTPLSAKTCLGKGGGGMLQLGEVALLFHSQHSPTTQLPLGNQRLFFCCKILDFSSGSLAMGVLDPGPIFLVKLSHHLGAGNGAGLF